MDQDDNAGGRMWEGRGILDIAGAANGVENFGVNGFRQVAWMWTRAE